MAERLLKEIINTMVGKTPLAPAPIMIIQPMEKTEGGLTMIEVRAFRELALGAGARTVAVYQAPEPLEVSKINFKDIAKQEQALTFLQPIT